jgi:hypothetical protein
MAGGSTGRLGNQERDCETSRSRKDRLAAVTSLHPKWEKPASLRFIKMTWHSNGHVPVPAGERA